MTRFATAVLVAVLSTAGCSSARTGEPGTDPSAAVADDTAADHTAAGTEGGDGGTSAGANGTGARFDIPPEHLPPPGQCRIWMPGEPPDRQARDHPIGRCSELRLSVPEDAWLVYRPTDDRELVRVWKYGSEREVLFQRIYDVTTGELVRHVAPASGD